MNSVCGAIWYFFTDTLIASAYWIPSGHGMKLKWQWSTIEWLQAQINNIN